jgi:hypothetical protein
VTAVPMTPRPATITSGAPRPSTIAAVVHRPRPRVREP